MPKEEILGFGLYFEKKKDRSQGHWYARKRIGEKIVRIYIGSDTSKAEEKIIAWLESHAEVKEELEGKGIVMGKCKICVHWKNEECSLPGFGECKFKAAKPDQVSSQPDQVETESKDTKATIARFEQSKVVNRLIEEDKNNIRLDQALADQAKADLILAKTEPAKQSGHGMVEIGKIKVGERMRSLNQDEVARLAESIKQIDLLNPIVVDSEFNLIAGYHRLEACKLLGWTKIKATISNLRSLEKELAEIDENLIRNELSAFERSEHLGKRKEIYEKLHPETKAGQSQAIAMNQKLGNNVGAESALTFAEDTAKKTGLSERTVQVDLQIAKNLSTEAKDFVINNGLANKKTALLEIAKAAPEKQLALAQEFAAGATVASVKAKAKPAKPTKTEPGLTELTKKLQETMPEICTDDVMQAMQLVDSLKGVEEEDESPKSKQTLQAQLDQALAELSRVRTMAEKTLEAKHALQAQLDQAKAELIQSLAEISKVKAELSQANAVQPTMFEPQPATDTEILALKDICKQKDEKLDSLKKDVERLSRDLKLVTESNNRTAREKCDLEDEMRRIKKPQEYASSLELRQEIKRLKEKDMDSINVIHNLNIELGKNKRTILELEDELQAKKEELEERLHDEEYDEKYGE